MEGACVETGEFVGDELEVKMEGACVETR